MRGSVYYQTAQLTMAIFRAGAKKEARTDPTHSHYECIASYRTMETYRNVWNNFGHYLREHWGLKDMERIEEEHVRAYIEYKIEYYPTRSYAAKLVAAIGKLETALRRYTYRKHGVAQHYDFSVRFELLHNARNLDMLAEGCEERAYGDPDRVVESLVDSKHRLAARIQLEGGARAEGVTLVRRDQLVGFRFDEIEGVEKGVLVTKEKGGKVGEVSISIEAYTLLQNYIDKEGRFSLRYRDYAADIAKAARSCGERRKGSHGLRWNFAQRRVLAYQMAGYTYDQALQAVSWEMKHYRKDITEHYLAK